MFHNNLQFTYFDNWKTDILSLIFNLFVLLGGYTLFLVSSEKETESGLNLFPFSS